jgi:hypothetical protein
VPERENNLLNNIKYLLTYCRTKSILPLVSVDSPDAVNA